MYAVPDRCLALVLISCLANFGSLSDLYGETTAQDAEDITSDWNGDVVEYRQDPVPKSDYHTQFEASEDLEDKKTDDPDALAHADADKIRYWADYSRVYLHPRSIQRLPDLPDWEVSEGDWAKGLEEFNRLEEDTDFMEETFRAFVEECDNLQGLQVINDASTFGSFTHALLTQFRDEFVKLPSFSFPILSGIDPRDVDSDDSRSLMKALNDALCLRSFSELSTITVPVQHPSIWSTGFWLQGLRLDQRSFFQSSALLATHIESATLPMRLKSTASTGDMSSLCSLLNWRENTRFATLSGAFPLSESDSLKFERDVYARIYDFSSLVEKPVPVCVEIVLRRVKADFAKTRRSTLPFARLDVTRGFTKESVASYNDWAGQFNPPPLSLYKRPCATLQYPNILPTDLRASQPTPHHRRHILLDHDDVP
ncbi:hypothetical protein EIP86_002273 [Pleurotus ostreatoroseus]|nr:hypothetical protein EIP86_002273 [Pleurotus ostreatoroseus]